MAFLVSPGVQVVEKDLTNIIPAVSTSIGGFAGLFEWGPALDTTQVSSEQDLIDKFGYPRISTNAGSSTRQDWYSAANFLSYTGNLQLVRVLTEGARNAASEPVKTAGASYITAKITLDSDFVAFDSEGEPRGDYDFTIAYDGSTSFANFQVQQTYVLSLDSEDAATDLGLNYADLQGGKTDAVNGARVSGFALTTVSTNDDNHIYSVTGSTRTNIVSILDDSDNVVPASEYTVYNTAGFIDSDGAFVDSDGSGTLIDSGASPSYTATSNNVYISFNNAERRNNKTYSVYAWASTDTRRKTALEDWYNNEKAIAARYVVIRDADSDAFQARNHNRKYVLADVISGFTAKLNELGVAAIADSEDINGSTAMYVHYPAGTYTAPAEQAQNGIKFEFSHDAAIDDDAEFRTNAIIQNLDDFLTDASGLTNGSVYARYPGKLGNSVGFMIVDAGVDDSEFRNTPVIGNSRLADLFDNVPATSVWGSNLKSDLNDEVHVVVYTTDANITGTANEVLETYAYLSKAKNAKTADGGPNYYVDVVNAASKWVHVLNEETAAKGAIASTDQRLSIGSTLRGTQIKSFKTLVSNGGIAGTRRYTLDGGNDGNKVTDADYMLAYDKLADAESVDVSLLITGARSKTVQKYVVELGEKRKDCVTFVSPDYASAVTNPSAEKIDTYFNSSVDGFNSTSYAVFDSGWKRQYDRYNDDYFWIPLNSDVAGLAARTDSTNEAWFSPAGLNRGFIKNSIKLSFNPDQAARDTLYPRRINPVVTFRGQGTLLYGDKTALSRPSAFDRINVRRLFIVLEKAIATAAKYQLFEFNDDLTRRTFVNAIEPFLADIMSRRGMTDYKVVCDTSNNTAEVIDSNRFVADIYIKPNRSINFITLNFVAVRSGVSFSEVAGA